MLITVLDKTKIIIFCGTWHGELWWICIKPLLTLFLSPATRICSGPLLRVTKEGVQSQLCIITVRICRPSRDFQLNRSKQSTTCVNAQWESDCSCIWLDLIPWTIFSEASKYYQVSSFRFSRENPEMVFYKEFVSSPEQSFMLLKRNVILPSPSTLPNKINPEGLTEERKNNLYREIRQFCKTGTDDLVAPAPWTFADIDTLDSVASSCIL